jgi:uncharacterized protein (DUF302 family)
MLSFPRIRAAALAFSLLLPALPAAADDGIIRVRSTYAMQETLERIKQDIASKGIMYFSEIDQAALAAAAGVTLRPSTLLIFGNPALGTLFITARPDAGLDWPVRLLITQDSDGQVWAVYSDFHWIAARHGIRDRDREFATATKVISSITASVAPK